MSNRYEREIEEILRNLEQAEPKPGLGQKFSGRQRRSSDRRINSRPRFSLSFHLSTSEWLLVVAVVVALIAGGYAHFRGTVDYFSIALASIGVVCMVLVALSQFILLPRRERSTRYGNITITPLRRGPLSNLKTRWNLFMLRMRYKRKREE
jgi:hypothetical protein